LEPVDTPAWAKLVVHRRMTINGRPASLLFNRDRERIKGSCSELFIGDSLLLLKLVCNLTAFVERLRLRQQGWRKTPGIVKA